MKVENVMNCSFVNWFPQFKKITTKSLILPLPDEFVEYLLADGVVLPDSEDHNLPAGEDGFSDDEEWDNKEEDDNVASAPSFPEFDRKLKAAIEELGGTVFPKLNWSSPKDATWIALNKSLCCYTITDIYLLLKSSDFITHDLTEPFKFCMDQQNQNYTNETNNRCRIKYYLILRKWTEIDPSTEFRCFVKDHKLIGISQRDCTHFYEHISKEKDDITEDIKSFFKKHIEMKFADKDYVFDIYRKKKGFVRLVDFNPFGKVTDPLLFDWQYLEKAVSENSEEPEFRHNSQNCGVQPSSYLHYAMPKDLSDLATGEDPFKLIDLLKLRRDSQLVDNSSSEDEIEVPTL